jgi:hypothetical protein
MFVLVQRTARHQFFAVLRVHYATTASVRL